MASTSEKYSLDPGFEKADVVFSKSKRVKCTGAGGALGHPLVWMDMGVDNQVQCKYCDRVFVFDGELGDGDGNAAT
jgi:uncharacterized Zn-finger protein